MQEAGVWVFVEVKYRSNDDYGGAIAAISPQKAPQVDPHRPVLPAKTWPVDTTGPL